jgi:hypothetical protein
MMRLLGFTAAAAVAWLCCLHSFFRREPQSLVAPLAKGQLEVWSAPHAQAPLRRNNPEWDLMGRTFAVLSFANLALSQPQARGQYLTAIDGIVDDTVAMEARYGQTYFLLPYADAHRRSLAVDGEVALMMAVRALLEGGDSNALRARLDVVERSLRASPLLLAESYPDEGWVFCNTTALAALRVADAALGTDHAQLIAAWLATARTALVDPKTGMLVSSFHLDGTPRDGPEGSSIWFATHMLALLDAPFGAQQYALAREKLGKSALGFAWAKEWPAEWPNADDVDSGPTIPLVEANAGSSGCALLAAATYGDRVFLEGLVASLQLAAFPVEHDGALHYAAGNTLADGMLLYALVQGPLWCKVKGEATCNT